MFRFLHLADVHLDTAFLGRSGAVRSHLRQALRTAYERAVDCALEEQVDAVLIAGDLFDNERLSFATEHFLIEQVGRLHQAGITCCYVTGNHDPGGRNYRTTKIEWPETFHYLDERRPSTVEIRKGGEEPLARVVGSGHRSPREQENLAAAFAPAEGGVPHIGLLHTLVTSADSAEKHDRYAPCSVEDLRRPGYQYWALGHIHRRQQVCSQAHAHYCGNLQGRTPRETGAKGGLLVTLKDGGMPEVEFRAFAPTQWETLHLTDLDEVMTFHDLERRTREAFEAVADPHPGVDWLLRVVLSGPCPLADELAGSEERTDLAEELTRALDAVDVEVRTESFTRPVEVDHYRDQTHVLGEILELLDELEFDPIRLAAVAPEVLAVEPEDPSTYLASLLEGLDREAVVRMLRKA